MSSASIRGDDCGCDEGEPGGVPSLEEMLSCLDTEEVVLEPIASAAPSPSAVTQEVVESSDLQVETPDVSKTTAIPSDDYIRDDTDKHADVPSLEELLGCIDAEEAASEPMTSAAPCPSVLTQLAFQSSDFQLEMPAVPLGNEFPHVTAIHGNDNSHDDISEQGDVPSLEELLGRIDEEEASATKEVMTPAASSSTATLVTSASVGPKTGSQGITGVKAQDVHSGTWNSLNTSENPFLRAKRTPHHVLVAQKILRAHQRKQAMAAAPGESPPAVKSRGRHSRQIPVDQQPAQNTVMPEPGVPEKLPGMPTLPARDVFPRRALAIGGQGLSSGKSRPSVPAAPEQSQASRTRNITTFLTSRPLRCSRSGSVHYCGAQCQRADWPARRKVCRVPDAVLRGIVPESQGTDRSFSIGSLQDDSRALTGEEASPSLEEMLAQMDQEEHDGV